MDVYQIKNELASLGIRPTIQRIQILEYLDQKRNHPTANEIFQHLQNTIPTLSKTTVYNTLKTFVDKGLVNELKIDLSESRFDINTEDHGHFRCLKCEKVYDFDFPHNNTDKDLPGFNIKTKNIYYTGICPECK